MDVSGRLVCAIEQSLEPRSMHLEKKTAGLPWQMHIAFDERLHVEQQWMIS